MGTTPSKASTKVGVGSGTYKSKSQERVPEVMKAPVHSQYAGYHHNKHYLPAYHDVESAITTPPESHGDSGAHPRKSKTETFLLYTDVLNKNAEEATEPIQHDSSITMTTTTHGVSGMGLPGNVYGVTDGMDPLSSYSNICDHCVDTIVRKNHARSEFTPSTMGVYPHPDTSMAYGHVCNTQSVSKTCTLTKHS